MKDIIRDIESKKDLEINLSRYANEMLSLYYRGALVRSSLNYYTYYQMLNDEGSIDTVSSRLIKCTNELLNGMSCGEDVVNLLNKIENLRHDNICVVDELTVYADIFSIYEYVLNRIEYKYKEPDNELSKLSDEDATKHIMKYILSDDDNYAVNSRIKEVITQIPIRMAKGKFFNYLYESMKLYKKSDRKSLDDYVYMIRTSSAACIDESNLTYFEDLKDIYNSFKKVDFSSIDEAVYDDLSNKLTYAIDFINNKTDKYVMLQNMINDLYIVTIARQYVMNKPVENEMYSKVVRKVGAIYDHKLSDEDDAELMDIFESMEGIQESVGEQCAKYDYILDKANIEYGDIIESIMAKGLYESLYTIQKLSSESSFINLSDSVNDKTIDDDYIEKAYEHLKDELMNAFQNDQKIIMRARISAILGHFPPIFDSLNEVQDYIYDSYSRCSDEAEKLASKEILLSMAE